MRYIDLLESFEIELNLLDDGLNKPRSADTEWWLNRGLEKFWKTRYSGINAKQTGFELDLKRTDDLRTLVVSTIYSNDINVISNSVYQVTLPDDYLILLGDTAGITPLDGEEDELDECWELDDDGNYVIKYSDTIESSIETVDRQIENILSDHRRKFSRAKPLRLILGNTVRLITDGTYKVARYILTYLRMPKPINIHLHPFDDYTDMPEHTHSEIVKIAAQMYMENHENQRISTHAEEIATME